MGEAKLLTAAEVRAMCGKDQPVPAKDKRTKEWFVLRAICTLNGLNKKDSKPDKLVFYPGIHVVFSGMNQGFRDLFGCESTDTVDAMDLTGQIEKRGAKGGPMIYLPGEKPENVASAATTYKKMGL